MRQKDNHHLLVCSDIEAWKDDDVVYLDRKFADGMRAYAERWNGPVSCLLKTSKNTKPVFGLTSSDSLTMFQTLTYDDDLSLSDLDFKQFDKALLPTDNFVQIKPILVKLNNLKIPTTLMIEYTLKTRFFTETYSLKNPIKIIRRYLYLLSEEYERKVALNRSAGIQANGIPAYNRYAKNQNSIVYYDTRARKKDLITAHALDQRLLNLKDGNKIRLAFSGRLSKIKGIDQLMQVANQLKNNKLSFSLDIFGDGDRRDWVEKFIIQHDLKAEVNVHGAVGFYEHLLPFLKKNIDIFIALHPQGDPSCTYVETFACGLPIIGFNNEAFEALIDKSNAGLTSPIYNTNDVCNNIMLLSKNHHEIVNLSKNALKFAEQHTMERTFNNRIEHLKDILNKYISK